MAKKIKFPLEMSEGIHVRTIEEMRENFNLDRVLGYFIDGKLKIWLEDRYYEEESEQIANLNNSDELLKSKICEILSVEYDEEDNLDIEILEARNKKLVKLNQFTDDEEILNNVDNVAFNQEELAELLDNEEPIIYLCNAEFKIPLSKENTRYIGVGIEKPKIVFSYKTEIDLNKLNIITENIELISSNGAIIIEHKPNNSKNTKEQNYDNMSNEEIINIALEYYNGNNREKNFVKYFDILNIAANKDSSEAKYLIGECYLEGLGIEENFEKGFSYFKLASLEGNTKANKELGKIYYNGIGTEKDYEQALKYFNKAKKAGLEGVDEELGKCKFKLAEIKAEQGDIDAIGDLGSYYYAGTGVTQNYVRAVQLFEKAANGGAPVSTRNLGICYLYGLGVTKSVSKAKSYMYKAISLGDSYANIMMETINSKSNW